MHTFSRVLTWMPYRFLQIRNPVIIRSCFQLSYRMSLLKPAPIFPSRMIEKSTTTVHSHAMIVMEVQCLVLLLYSFICLHSHVNIRTPRNQELSHNKLIWFRRNNIPLSLPYQIGSPTPLPSLQSFFFLHSEIHFQGKQV